MRLIIICLVGLASIGLYEYFSPNNPSNQQDVSVTNRPITQYAGKKKKNKKNNTKKQKKQKKMSNL
jgi:hypothetical protein